MCLPAPSLKALHFSLAGHGWLYPASIYFKLSQQLVSLLCVIPERSLSILSLHLFASAFKLFLSPRNSHHNRLGEKGTTCKQRGGTWKAWGPSTQFEITIAMFTDTVNANVLIAFTRLSFSLESGVAVMLAGKLVRWNSNQIRLITADNTKRKRWLTSSLAAVFIEVQKKRCLYSISNKEIE